MMRVVIGLLVFAMLIGCTREDAGPTFVVINGRSITAGEVKEGVLVQAKLSELVGNKIPESLLPKWGNDRAVTVLQSLISGTLIEQDLAAQNLQPESEDVDQVVRSYNQIAKCDAEDIDDFAVRLGALAKPFKRWMEMSAAVSYYERKFWKPNITDLMIQQHINFMSNRLVRAKESDQQAWNRARAAHARLKSGEKWMTVAREFSEDKLLNPNNEKFISSWVCVGPDAVGIQPLAKVLPAMNKGDFTEPLDTRDGLLIVRLEGMEGQLYRLSRILFRLSRPMIVPKDKETARKDLEKELSLSARQQTLNRLWKNAKFEYPMGTNFNYRIWKGNAQ